MFQFSQELLKLGPRNLVYIWTLKLGSLLFFSLNLSIFQSVQGQIASQFSHELCKLQSSNLTCIWRLSNCIIGSRLRLVVLILFFIYLFTYFFFFLLYFSMFFLSLCWAFTMKFCVTVFSRTVQTTVFKHGIHMENISIFHVCMVSIEKSVTRVTDRHHEACRVMPNSDSEWQIFLSTPYTHDRYFFLHTSWLTTFDFQSRTCYERTLFPLKGLYLSLKKSTLPATAVRFFTLTFNLHKVTTFSDVTAVKKPTSLDDIDTWLPIQPTH